MRKLLIGIAILAIMFVSGCLTETTDVKIDGNGEVEQYNVKLETNSDVYGMINSLLEENGTSLQEVMESQGCTYKEVWDKGNVTIITSGLPKENNVTVTKTDEYIIYEEDIAGDEEDMAVDEEEMAVDEEEMAGDEEEMAGDGFLVKHYYLEMPTDIIESNADVVNGNKAEWHMKENKIRNIYAKSKVPTFSATLSGFEILGAVLILLIVRKLKR